MKWLEEIRATRLTFSELGFLLVVKEVFQNDLKMSLIEADDILGAGWRGMCDGLKKRGILNMVVHCGMVRMWVVAPGDSKRARLKRTQQLKRDFDKFEEKIREGLPKA